MDKLIFYTDGSCSPNRGYGGLGLYGYRVQSSKRNKNIKHPAYPSCNFTEDGLSKDKPKEPIEVIRIYELIESMEGDDSSNNDAELIAFTRALEIAHREEEVTEVLIISDSNYVVSSYNERLDTWKENGWKKTNGKEIAHEKDWRVVLDVKGKLVERGVEITVRWVKGHSTDVGNQIADMYSVIGSNASRYNHTNGEDFVKTIYSSDSDYKHYKATYTKKDVLYYFKDLIFSSSNIDDENYCFLASTKTANNKPEIEKELGRRSTNTVFGMSSGYVPNNITLAKKMFRAMDRKCVVSCCIKLNRLDDKEVYRLFNMIPGKYLLVENTSPKGQKYLSLVFNTKPFVFELDSTYPFLSNSSRVFSNLVDLDNDEGILDTIDLTDLFISEGKLKIKNTDRYLEIPKELPIINTPSLKIGKDTLPYLALKNIEDVLEKVELLVVSCSSSYIDLVVKFTLDNRVLYTTNINNRFLKSLDHV